MARDPVARLLESKRPGGGGKGPAAGGGQDFRNYATSELVSARALAHVISAVHRSEELQLGLLRRVRECYLAYRTLPEKRFYQGRANIAVPSAYKAVEVLHADTMETLFGMDHWFRCEARLPEYERRTEQIEGLLRHDTVRSNFEGVFDDILKAAEIGGTGIGKVRWKFPGPHIKQRVTREFTAGDGQPFSRDLVLDMPDTMAEGPALDFVFRDDFLISQPMCRTVQDQPFVVERFTVTEPELRRKAKAGIYKNVDRIKKYQQSAGTEVYASEQQELRDARIMAYTGQVGSDFHACEIFDKPAEWILHEYWGLFDPFDRGEYEEWVITVANLNTVLRVQRNPFWRSHRPYVHLPYVHSPGEFDGVGVVEPIRFVYRELNDKRNQSMDAVTLMLNPMAWVGLGAGLGERQVVAAPGQMIPVTTVNEVKEVSFNTAALNVAAGQEEVIRRDIDESTGATPIASGMAMPGVEKTGVFTGMVERVAMRLKQVVRRAERETMGPALSQMWWLNQQLRTQAVAVKILGRDGHDFQKVTPAELSGDYTFKPQGALHMTATFTRNASVMQFAQMFAGLLQSRPEVQWRLARKVYRDVLHLDGVDRIIPETPFINLVPPEYENEMIANGHHFPAQPGEDHQAHIQAHMQLGESPVKDFHIQSHMYFANMAAQEAQQRAMTATAGGSPNVGSFSVRPGGSPTGSGTGDAMNKQGAENATSAA